MYTPAPDINLLLILPDLSKSIKTLAGISPIPLPGGSALADALFVKIELLMNKTDKITNKGKNNLIIFKLIFIFNFLIPLQLRLHLRGRYKMSLVLNHILHLIYKFPL